ncbi:cyclase family protein [Roseicella sp. DB1501]|uniref:cyclase family protein n=1 Tax=Roseicella sp. DB1501 TaxID=2730925 RepID=UPI00149214E6|nr:cyclase family protein [Roseicella sp. DB1501]NOG72253.1 cyclase family protein [Roseicella sp. DB1501]
MQGIGRLLAAASIGVVAAVATTPSLAQDAGMKKWTQGKGWGWVWGAQDEVGALNEMTDQSRAAALRLASQGKTYDLGLPYDRNSYRWPGHNPGEIISFRTPEGVARQQDLPFTTPQGGNTGHTRWHSSAMFISDNVATQIDGLAHITHGEDNHWYNGFKESDWGGNFGVRKADVTTIPPIVARGVMIDVAGQKGVEALPKGYEITVADLEAALRAQNVDVTPGTVVLIRTGTARYWGENGGDHAKLSDPDTAGIGMAAAKWLVEQKGAMMIAADTSGLECIPARPQDSAAVGGSFNPVHVYLLVQQGVHIGEFHNLERLAADRTYEFAYVATTNAIRGTVAGTALRPLALR